VPLFWVIHDVLQLVLVPLEFGSVKTTVRKISWCLWIGNRRVYMRGCGCKSGCLGGQP